MFSFRWSVNIMFMHCVALCYSFSNLSTICAIRDSQSCPLHQIGVPYHCSALSPTSCACTEPSAMSKVIFIIDNTAFTNDYSWYFWAIDWIKLYQTKILANQPLLMKNVTYIHIGDDIAKYKVTRNYNPFTNTQIIPNSIWNSWTIPAILQNNSAPNFCDAMKVALQITPPHDLHDLIIVYLANTSPAVPNAIVTCNESLYGPTATIFNNFSIPLYVIRSSPAVDVEFINNEFKISLLSNLYNNTDTADWGSVYDEATYTYAANQEKASKYVDGIVSTSADFICQNSRLCDVVLYASNQRQKCRTTCTSMDVQCLTDMLSSKYYITNSFSGLDSLDMTQNTANEQCVDNFGTHLASLKSKSDVVTISQLMDSMNVNQCWIGINETVPMYTIQDTAYFKWMDGNINSFPNLTVEDTSIYSNACVSITNNGLQVNDCNQYLLSCSICNVKDDAVLTVLDRRNFLIYSDNTLTWQQADIHCNQQFNTHLSTMQLQTDVNSITALATETYQVADVLGIMESEFHIWSGQKILISYNDCIDFWHRKFNIIYADGSKPVLNRTLIDLQAIIIDTCAPTAAPTDSPTQSPTNAPTFSPTNAPTNSPTAAPTNAPTTAPSNAPTRPPTNAPTNPPTRSPTDSPTQSPTVSPVTYIPKPGPPSTTSTPVPDVLPIILPPTPEMQPFPPFTTPGPPTNSPTYPKDPFTPSRSPVIPKSYTPLEPSRAPTLNPTLSPLYVSNQCVTLVVKMVNDSVLTSNANEKQYEYSWITTDCSGELSSWSCNAIDRASYQANNDEYYVLMDDDKSWSEANSYCQHVFGTSLSTVYTAQDMKQIVDMKNDMKTAHDIEPEHASDEAIWIGMRLDNGNFAESKLSWSDNSISNYSNLVSGCAAIDGNNASLWTLQMCTELNTHYWWSCNDFVPTAAPTLSPTVLVKEVETELSALEKVMHWIMTYPLELIYMLVLVLSLLITVFAFFHSKSAHCCCDGCVISYADDAKYICAFLFGLQFWDFASDISFAYNLPNKSANIIFLLSVIFIFVPWLINILFLLLYRYNWSTNAEVSNWLREHTSKLVLCTMVCGGAQTSVELMNSRMFGLDIFQMGLSRMQLIETGKFKVLLTTVLENIPQIFCTTYWMLQTGFNDFAIASLISSTCSVILVVAATILIRMDNLQDEQIEFVLDYKLIRTKQDKKNRNRKKLNKIGLHTKLATCIANVLELNPNMVYIDKHVIGFKTITLNVSVTHALRQDVDGNEEEEEEDEENLISRASVIYKLRGDQCEEIMHGIIEILGIDNNDIRISSVTVVPLDYNGAKLDICKKTHFDERHLKRDKTEWCYRDKTNLFQSNNDYINILPQIANEENENFGQSNIYENSVLLEDD